jgi:hypothetical protein
VAHIFVTVGLLFLSLALLAYCGFTSLHCWIIVVLVLYLALLDYWGSISSALLDQLFLL